MLLNHRLSGLVASSLSLEKTLVQERQPVTLVSEWLRDRDDDDHQRSADFLAVRLGPTRMLDESRRHTRINGQAEATP
jgi:hypothetical protein